MNSEKTEGNERQILIEIIDKLCVEHMFKKGREGEKEFEMLLTTQNEDGLRYLKRKARETADRIYGKIIYIRGLIEFTNYCKNNCFYCGIRKDNNRIQRYRLSAAIKVMNLDFEHLYYKAVKMHILQMTKFAVSFLISSQTILTVQ